MNDVHFLNWLFERLEFVHGEKRNADYMLKFRSIIEDYPAEKLTPNIAKACEKERARDF